MSNLKTHFSVFPHSGSACSRGTRTSESIHRVDCRLCQATPAFVQALADYKAKVEADFAEQTPRTVVPQFGRVNAAGVMECYKCSGVLFRERPRSLFSYHYVCASCGTSMHPMTETGMST